MAFVMEGMRIINKRIMKYAKSYPLEAAKTKEAIAPFRLLPAYKDYLWGGNKLKSLFGKDADMDIIAESWELSAHPDGESIIGSGKLKGMAFGDFVAKYPEACGKAYNSKEAFPILIKLIDARGSLSIQVHPGDEYARKVENENGKTEMWIILDCDEDAFLYYGFNKSISREEAAKMIADGTITDALFKKAVKPGDVVYIPAGTVHAIGEGILLAEIQQSSNSTYRVYDFGRLGADGKARELHVEKALDVAILEPAADNEQKPHIAQITDSYALEKLVSCPYFSSLRLNLDGSYFHLMKGESFAAFLCVDGGALMESEAGSLPVAKGDCVFVPANTKGIMLKGSAVFILARLGEA